MVYKKSQFVSEIKYSVSIQETGINQIATRLNSRFYIFETGGYHMLGRLVFMSLVCVSHLRGSCVLLSKLLQATYVLREHSSVIFL